MNLIPVKFETESFYADVLGLIELPDRNPILGCLGIIGKRTGLGRALVHLKEGNPCWISSGEKVDLLGKLRYRVLQIPMGRGLQRLFVLPESTLVLDQDAQSDPAKAQSGDNEADECNGHMQVLVWRGAKDDHLRAWRAIQQASNIPLQDHWGERLLPLLSDHAQLDSLRTAAGIRARHVPRFVPMTWRANLDGLFHGHLVNIDEEDLIVAVRHLLTTQVIDVIDLATSSLQA